MEETIEHISPADPIERDPHSWVMEELGDTELARVFEEHPEFKEELLNGEGLPSKGFFSVLREVNATNPELADHVGKIVLHDGRLPELTYERIVGPHSEKAGEDFLLSARFIAGEQARLARPEEQEKREDEKAIFDYVVKTFNALRVRYGLPELSIMQEQVHMLHVPNFSGKTSGFTSIEKQGVYVATKDIAPLREHITTTHELEHLMSYGAMYLEEKDDGRQQFRLYRTGLSVVSVDERGIPMHYLNRLNEAMTEEIADRVVAQIPEDDPILGPAVTRRLDGLVELMDSCEKNGEKLPYPPHWITDVRKEEGRLALNVSYPNERLAMFSLFSKIYQRNPAYFEGQTEEEAKETLFAMLQKAMFTGNILPFGRLFNDTFGRGKFREYGHLQTNEEIDQFLATL